jgi:hypothetical protein
MRGALATILCGALVWGCDPSSQVPGSALRDPDLSKIPSDGFGVPATPDPFEPGVSDPRLYEPAGGGGAGGGGGGMPPGTIEPVCEFAAPTRLCDGDGDGAGGTCGGVEDCDDAAPDVFAGAPDRPGDGVDQDCADGDAPLDDAAGIFVVAGAADDAAGTAAEPVGTVARGIELAEEAGLAAVFVAAGDYDETVTSTVSLYGGYDAMDWTPDAGPTRLAEVTIAAAPAAVRGLTVDTLDLAGPPEAPACENDCPAIVAADNVINPDRTRTVSRSPSRPDRAAHRPSSATRRPPSRTASASRSAARRSSSRTASTAGDAGSRSPPIRRAHSRSTSSAGPSGAIGPGCATPAPWSPWTGWRSSGPRTRTRPSASTTRGAT